MFFGLESMTFILGWEISYAILHFIALPMNDIRSWVRRDWMVAGQAEGSVLSTDNDWLPHAVSYIILQHRSRLREADLILLTYFLLWSWIGCAVRLGSYDHLEEFEVQHFVSDWKITPIRHTGPTYRSTYLCSDVRSPAYGRDCSSWVTEDMTKLCRLGWTEYCLLILWCGYQLGPDRTMCERVVKSRSHRSNVRWIRMFQPRWERNYIIHSMSQIMNTTTESGAIVLLKPLLSWYTSCIFPPARMVCRLLTSSLLIIFYWSLAISSNQRGRSKHARQNLTRFTILSYPADMYANQLSLLTAISPEPV